VNTLLEAGVEVQSFLVSRGWQFCFIGGIAVLRWGEPRLTRDLDLTVYAGFGNEVDFVDPLLEAFGARLPEMRSFALARRVLLLRSAKGYPIDIALGGLDYEKAMVSRSTLFSFYPGLELRTCSAEDLIVMKAFAERERDWADIEGIVTRQSGKLDWPYIETQLTPLAEAKESPEMIARLESLRRRGERHQ
jgi:hypothetical protein